MLYSLGTDVSKDKFDACLLAYSLTKQNHEVIARRTFDNTQSGFKAAIKWVTDHTPKAASVRATMEATGVYYESLALFIDKHYPEVHQAVVLPSKSKKYIESRGLRSKTDKIDAYGLALMGAERNLRAWDGINPFWRRLRAMTRTRSALMDQRIALRNQLHALRHGGVVAEEAIESLLTCIDKLTEEIDSLYYRITKMLGNRKELSQPIEWLQTIPGVGLLTIATILAETNGFNRFTSISQLISFSGYDVLVRQSGQWKGKSAISKQGNNHIRRAMYMPASAVVRCEDGPIWEFYERLRARHDQEVKMKAHVAVQKKLLRYMYTLWNKQEPFDPGHIRRLQAHHQNIAPPEGEATVDTSSTAA